MKKRLSISLLFILILSGSKAQMDENALLDFIVKNKARASLVMVINDTTRAKLNENKLMPLASTLKIIVALEFAKQASKFRVDTGAYIPLSELKKYYLENTDGGAHPSWIEYEKKLSHVKKDSVKLIDIARGMIQFSSNANTEFLIDLLGPDNVNSNLSLLGLKKHTPIYHIVSSLFIYQNPKSAKEAEVLAGIRKLSEKDYYNLTMSFHNSLKRSDELIKKFRPQDLSVEMQRLWSSRLPASTTMEYTKLAYIINRRKFFDKSTYSILSRILESVMENPANGQWLAHAGIKGGSTMFVLTKCVYATTKKGDKIELAYFFNDLTRDENQKLQSGMNAFELRVLTDPAFIKTTTAALR